MAAVRREMRAFGFNVREVRCSTLGAVPPSSSFSSAAVWLGPKKRRRGGLRLGNSLGHHDGDAWWFIEARSRGFFLRCGVHRWCCLLRESGVLMNATARGAGGLRFLDLQDMSPNCFANGARKVSRRNALWMCLYESQIYPSSSARPDRVENLCHNSIVASNFQ